MLKRNKYNYKFRLECVELIVKKRQATIRVAKEKGIPYTNLRLWVGFYNKYGRDGLKGQENKHYDALFKFKVLQSIDKELLSLKDACVRYDIAAASSITSWRDAYESNGYQGLISKPKGRPPKMKPPIKLK
jgi:transposase